MKGYKCINDKAPKFKSSRVREREGGEVAAAAGPPRTGCLEPAQNGKGRGRTEGTRGPPPIPPSDVDGSAT